MLNFCLLSHPALDLTAPASSAKCSDGSQADQQPNFLQQNSELQDEDEQQRITGPSVAATIDMHWTPNQLSELEARCLQLKQDNGKLKLKTLALKISLRETLKDRDDLNGVWQHQRKREDILEARHLALLEESEIMREKIKQIQDPHVTRVSSRFGAQQA